MTLWAWIAAGIVTEFSVTVLVLSVARMARRGDHVEIDRDE